MTAHSINEPPGSAGNPMPFKLDSLDPAEAVSGSPDFTLYLSGTDIPPGSVIVFAGHDEPTTLEDDGTLSTGVKPSLFAPATVQVQVRFGQYLSNALEFSFTDGAEEDTALASEAELGRMSRGDLDDLARDRDVDITDAHNKDDVIQALLKDERKRKRKR